MVASPLPTHDTQFGDNAPNHHDVMTAILATCSLPRYFAGMQEMPIARVPSISTKHPAWVPL